MNLKNITILNKEKKQMNNIREIYKRRFQAEIESYKDSEDKNIRDTIQAQDILILDKISI